MKATFSFELPTEQVEYDTYRRGPSYIRVIEELDEWMRQKVKYESDAHHEQYLAAIHEARAKLYELVAEIDA